MPAAVPKTDDYSHFRRALKLKVAHSSCSTAASESKEEEIIREENCFNHRAIATFIEVLAFLYWFFNTLQKYIYVQNSRCVLFWNHLFFHKDAPPPPPTLAPKKENKETILYKECKWKLWKVKYENVFKITF